MDLLKTQNNNVSLQGGSVNSAGGLSLANRDEIIRSEVRELREREKRKDSIIRGFNTSSEVELISHFNEISNVLRPSKPNITQSNVMIIKPGLARANITNLIDRQDILANSKKLVHTHPGIFLSRDLRYKQHSERTARRMARNDVAGAVQSEEKTENTYRHCFKI